MVYPEKEFLLEIANVSEIIYKYKKKYPTFTKISILNDTNLCSSDLFLANFFKNNIKNSTFLYYISNTLDLQGLIYLSLKQKKIYIVFRGSESKYDWFYNLHIKKINLFDNVYVHSGYYKLLMIDNTFNIIKQIIIELSEIYINYEICLTGHSCGSGLATLSTFLLSRELPNYKFSNYTFGSPRIGNYDFVDTFESSNCKCFTIINNSDMVARIPSLGYYNMKNLIFIDEKNKKIQFKTIKPIKNWLYNSVENLLDLLYNFSFYDHKMSNYITNIKRFYQSS